MPALSLPFTHHTRDRPLYAVAEPCPPSPHRVEPSSEPDTHTLIAADRLASRADRTSEFFRALCKGYQPPPLREPKPKPIPIPDEITPSPSASASLPFPVDWTRPKPPPRRRKVAAPTPLPDNLPRDVLQKAIYTPHGKWAWAAGLPFKESEESILLSCGVMCSAFLKTGMIGHRPVKYVAKVWLTKEKWHGFFSELALYKVQLKSLQGRIVPAIINVYSSIGAVSVAMEPPHPSFWLEASPSMPHVLKKRCVEAFESLHAAGVLHGDVELRHMLIGGDARVTIIDFQASRALVPNAAVHLVAATPDDLRMEMRKVRFKLDYGDARAWEDAKLMRAARLKRRNWERGGEGEGAPLEEDVRDPPIASREWNLEWIGVHVEPTRFVMPGQSKEELERAVDEFISVIEKLEKEEEETSVREDAPQQRRPSPEFKPPSVVPQRPPAAGVGMGFGGTITLPSSGTLKRKIECERPAGSPKRPRTDAPSQDRSPAPVKARDFAYTNEPGPTGSPKRPRTDAPSQHRSPAPVKARDFAYKNEPAASPPACAPPARTPRSECALPPNEVNETSSSPPGKRKRTTTDPDAVEEEADAEAATRARPKMRGALSRDVSSSVSGTGTEKVGVGMHMDVCDPERDRVRPETETKITPPPAKGVAFAPPLLFRWMETFRRFVY